jgi:hypothetical protein
MTGLSAIFTAIRLWIKFLCFADGFLAGFKFSQISPVKHHRKVATGNGVNLMIAVVLGIVVYIVLLFHSAIFDL